MDIWIVVIFFLLQKCCSGRSYLCFCVCFFFNWNTQRWNCWVMGCVHCKSYTYCQIIFQNMRVPLSLYLGQHFVQSDLKKFTNLMGVNCYFILICIFLIASEIQVSCISFIRIYWLFSYWIICLFLISSFIIYIIIVSHVCCKYFIPFHPPFHYILLCTYLTLLMRSFFFDTEILNSQVNLLGLMILFLINKQVYCLFGYTFWIPGS